MFMSKALEADLSELFFVKKSINDRWRRGLDYKYLNFEIF